VRKLIEVGSEENKSILSDRATKWTQSVECEVTIKSGALTTDGIFNSLFSHSIFKLVGDRRRKTFERRWWLGGKLLAVEMSKQTSM
jgi:hypothetical protein